MKKTLILMAALPMLCVGGGFGAGVFLGDSLPAAEATEHLAEAAPTDPQEALFGAAAEAAPQQTADSATQDSAEPPVQLARAEGEPDTPKPPKQDSRNVVKLGSLTVPVYRPQSVTYVVADLGVAMQDSETAAHYRISENAVRLRDVILASFRKAAENPRMRRAALDSDWLSETLTEDLRARFSETQEVLFLTLYKKDVPRS